MYYAGTWTINSKTAPAWRLEMKYWMKRTIGAISIFIIMGIVLFYCQNLRVTAAEKRESPRVLTVAFPESAGINETYEDGTHGGCVYDWLYEIAKYTGWEYEFVTGDSSELLDGMMNCEYDIMGGMFYYDGYEEFFQYPEYIMGSNNSLLVYKQDDSSIKNYDYKTLNGKRIGMLEKATGKIERLKKFIDFNNLTCELVYYKEIPDYEKCLDRGEVDLIYGSDVSMQEGYNVAAMIEGDPYYLVTAIDEPELCEQLSAAMESIYAANPNFAEELYEKYFPKKYINSLVFTEEEKAFIKNHNVIRIAVEEDQYPIYYEEDGEKRGMVPTFLSLMEDRTGLSFEYVHADSYEALFTLLEEGQADVIGSFADDDQWADSRSLSRTACYASLNTVILRNKRTSQEECSVIAVPGGRDVEPELPSDTVKYYDSYENCVAAVNRGEADYTRLPASIMENLYAKDYYPNVLFTAESGQMDEVALALPKPVETTLYSILNKAINSLQPQELESILGQNMLMPPTGTMTFKSLFYANPIVTISVCVGLVVLISAAILLITYYRMKNRVMKVRLEKAQETTRAKSDFLSRMSHEIRTPMNAIIGLTNLTLLTGEATPAIREDLAKIDSSAQFLLTLLNDILDMSKIESNKMDLELSPFDLQEVITQLQNIFTLQMEQKQIALHFECEVKETQYIGDKVRLSQILTNLLSNAYKFTQKGGEITFSVMEEETGEDCARLKFSVKDNGIGVKEEDRERIFHSFEQAGEHNKSMPGTGLGLSICRSLVKLMGGELLLQSEVNRGSEFFFTIELPVYRGVIEGSDSQTQEEISLAGKHILLAEDNDINAEIAVELLALEQVFVERAQDGQQAVDFFASHPEGYFDLILMDINMPVKNGLEASIEIRGMNRADAGTIPILAMTANTFQEDRQEAMEAGMTGFLPKPFDVRQLYQIIQDSL